MSAVLSTAPAVAASPIWYSKMERVLAELMANQEPAHTLLTKVEAWAKAGKFKADELHYSGLTDWLKLQEGKVAKQQVMDYLSAHGVQVTETVLGEKLDPAQVALEAADAIDENGIYELDNGTEIRRTNSGGYYHHTPYGSRDIYNLRDFFAAFNGTKVAGNEGAKFSRYVLKGGKNYRELLLTLPTKGDFRVDENSQAGYWNIVDSKTGEVLNTVRAKSAESAAESWRANNAKNSKAQDGFRSSHFDQPNILAHVRFNERVDADGKRVLFIEELQSDWAQKGKRDGFQGPVLTAKQEARYQGLKNKLMSERSDDELTELNDLQEKVDALVKTGPPSAPFVTKTEAWVSLAIKRLIRYAAEKDFDRVAFTTGAQQADRYDLSHQVSQIRYRESDGILQTWKHDIDPEGYQEPTIEQVVQADKLADFIGKEAAARIVDADPDSDGWKSLKGQALKVGGAGMTIFYDVLLPNITNDVLRRLGGGKVEMVNLYHKVGDYGAKNVKTGKVVEGLILSKEDAAKADPAIYETFLLNRAPVDMTPDAKEFLVQPTFDITPALRAKALEGLPLFFRGEKSAASTDLREATAAIDNIKAEWQNAPKINVWASIEDAPAVLAARIKKEVGRTVKGAWFGGEIHLFPENIGSIPELLRVVVHEGRHAGLEGVFGERLSEALKNLYEKNDALRLDVDRRRQATKLDIVTQVNEVLADMPLTAAKKLSGWKRVTGAMKSWLEDKGFKPLADWIVGPTGDELVKDVLYQADEWIRSGKRPATITNDVLFHRAFHGTPHDFDRFDIGNIGIGEGAQAFGHGLYFAGKREVADGYRIALTSGGAKKQFEVAAALAASKWFTSGMKVGGKKYYDRMELQGDIADQRLSSMDMPDDVRQVFADKLSEPNGYLYEVELAPKESDYLDHDEPVYEYSDVAKKVNRLFREKFGYKDGNYFQGTSNSGGEFYASVGKAVATEMGLLEQYGTQLTKNEAKIASEFLKEAGIPGIRYLDGSSRSAGEGNHNYVIFDAKDISITAKFSRAPQTDTQAFRADDKVSGMKSSAEIIAGLTSKQLNERSRLQNELRAVENRVAYGKVKRDTPQYESALATAKNLRNELAKLTGDPYGEAKTRSGRRVDEFPAPSADALNAEYLAPDDVPKSVRRWVRSNAQTLTSDATDAVRWGRIIDTLQDDRYPSGNLTIYRAIENGDEIRPGDWVTTDEDYAKSHNDRYFNGRGQVLSETVDGRDVLASPTGNAEEAIYAPRSLSGPIKDQRQAPQIRFSRTRDDEIKSANAAAEYGISKVTRMALGQKMLKQMLSNPGQFNAINKTLNTQLHKALKNEEFGKVFWAGQQFMEDVSQLASQAAELAPEILPNYGNIKNLGMALRDTVRPFKSSQRNKDIKAAGAAIFDGTMEGGGNPLLGQVFTDKELSDAKLTPEAITFYKQSRQVIDKSLDDLAMSEVVRMLGERVKIEPAMMEFLKSNPNQFRAGLMDAIATAKDNAAPEMVPGWEDIEKRARETFDHADALKAAGYAPLMRFGKFFVTVREVNEDGQRETIYRAHYENRLDLNAAMKDLKLRYPKSEVSKGTISEEDFKLMKGMTPETIMLFADKLGLPMEMREAAQKYYREAVSARSAMKRRIERKGTAGYSDDLPRVLAGFVTSNARRAAANYNMPVIKGAIENIDQDAGDVRDEAMKMVEQIESPTEDAAALRGVMYAYFIGGSLASAMVNMTQPLTMTLPYLGQWGNAKASAAMVKAMRTNSKLPQNLKDALHLANEKGITDPQEVYYLYQETIRGISSNRTFQKGMGLWSSMFSIAENLNRRTTFLAAYDMWESADAKTRASMIKETGAKNGFDFAKRTVQETQGIYNKGNRPNWARGWAGATVFTFKQYTIAYLELLSRLPPQQKMVMLATLVLLSGLGGLPGEEDAEDLIDTIGQAMGYNTNSKMFIRQKAADILGEVWMPIVMQGVSGIPGSPIDVSSRLGLGNLIPGTSLFQRSESNSAGKEITEAIGPIGGIIGNAVNALKAAQAGELTDAMMNLAPTAIGNFGKGMKIAQTGESRDYKDRKTIDGLEFSDGFWKGIGFNPKQVADEGRVSRMIGQDVRLLKDVESDLAGKIAKAIAKGDEGKLESAWAEVREWNEKNPETPIAITDQQIRRRLADMNTSREIRQMKTIPKESRSFYMENMK
jgi:hypothetical protein